MRSTRGTKRLDKYELGTKVERTLDPYRNI